MARRSTAVSVALRAEAEQSTKELWIQHSPWPDLCIIGFESWLGSTPLIPHLVILIYRLSSDGSVHHMDLSLRERSTWSHLNQRFVWWAWTQSLEFRHGLSSPTVGIQGYPEPGLVLYLTKEKKPWTNGVLVTSSERKALICDICQFPWCKSCHHSYFQAINLKWYVEPTMLSWASRSWF